MEIYALCDQDMIDNNNISILEFLEIAQSNNAQTLQYRNKSKKISFIKSQLEVIRKNYDGKIIINDMHTMVKYCDGLHLGQEDLYAFDTNIVNAVDKVRRLIGREKIFGLSTHNKEEVLISNNLDLDYIGLGAYKKSTTKTDVSSILGDDLDEIASYSKHLVAVIGGVKKDDIFENAKYLVIGSGLLGDLN